MKKYFFCFSFLFYSMFSHAEALKKTDTVQDQLDVVTKKERLEAGKRPITKGDWEITKSSYNDKVFSLEAKKLDTDTGKYKHSRIHISTGADNFMYSARQFFKAAAKVGNRLTWWFDLITPIAPDPELNLWQDPDGFFRFHPRPELEYGEVWSWGGNSRNPVIYSLSASSLASYVCTMGNNPGGPHKSGFFSSGWGVTNFNDKLYYSRCQAHADYFPNNHIVVYPEYFSKTQSPIVNGKSSYEFKPDYIYTQLYKRLRRNSLPSESSVVFHRRMLENYAYDGSFDSHFDKAAVNPDKNGKVTYKKDAGEVSIIPSYAIPVKSDMKPTDPDSKPASYVPVPPKREDLGVPAVEPKGPIIKPGTAPQTQPRPGEEPVTAPAVNPATSPIIKPGTAPQTQPRPGEEPVTAPAVNPATSPQTQPRPLRETVTAPFIKPGTAPQTQPRPGEEPVTAPAVNPGTNTIVRPSNANNTLPAFCVFAEKLCQWLDWTQAEHEQEKERDNLDIEEKRPDRSVSEFDVDYLNFGGHCPTPTIHNIPIGSISVPLEMNITPICDLAKMVRPAILALAYLLAMGIVARAISNT